MLLLTTQVSDQGPHGRIQRRQSASYADRMVLPRWEPDNEPPTEFIVFVELDTREADGLTVSLEWDRDTGATQVVVQDVRAASQMAFPVPQARAADAFRHPFRYAP